MIEKLKPNEDKVFKTETGEYLTIPELGVPKPISDKINELVDAVNELQAQVAILQEHAHPTAKTEPAENGKCAKIAQPELAETVQKENLPGWSEAEKWIGKLCIFQEYDGAPRKYGILTNIKYKDDSFLVRAVYCTVYGNTKDEYSRCEPVKPDDDIIYKGGDNE